MLSTNAINFSSSGTRKRRVVMPGPCAGIHALSRKSHPKTWMAGTSPAMTVWMRLPWRDQVIMHRINSYHAPPYQYRGRQVLDPRSRPT